MKEGTKVRAKQMSELGYVWSFDGESWERASSKEEAIEAARDTNILQLGINEIAIHALVKIVESDPPGPHPLAYGIAVEGVTVRIDEN